MSAHDWVADQGTVYLHCSKCSAWSHPGYEDSAQPCSVEPPKPDLGATLSKALNESAFDRLDRKFKGG